MNKFIMNQGVALTATLVTQLCFAQASNTDAPKPERYLIGAQITTIEQGLFRFRSPYQGTNSLQSIAQGRLSDTYTVFLGERVCPDLELYVNPEMARGGGVSNALGLAGYTNGDVIRNPTIGQDPYLARYFARWTLSTGSGEEDVERGENQIPGKRPTHRLVITAGKIGSNDLFDTNAYANSTRTQFMNWALINNAAYDYAADTRGYTKGVALEWDQPSWALRLGSFEMPKVANGSDLSGNISDNRGEQIELETHPRLSSRWSRSTVRLLGYRNFANMGNYRDSVALAGVNPPDITATRKPRSVKYGFALGFEQPLKDDGDTAVFGRLGWNDGKTESFAYTEAEDHVSLGVQVSGKQWRRPGDRFAVALVSDGLSAAHRDYLGGGGLGFLLGDGKLNYGRENILESYYLRQVNRLASLTLDWQFIQNPGYNRDRGPVPVVSVRLHLEF